MRSCSLLSVLLVLAGCAASAPAPSEGPAHAAAPVGPDPHSFSQPQQVRVTHMGLTLHVNFAARQLDGTVQLRVERADPQAPLLLDTRELEILSVETASAELDLGAEGTPALALREAPIAWQKTEASLGEAYGSLGRPLRVQLPEGVNLVQVRYRTSTEASGLQWLAPEQTAGKEHPFLYSQSQAIHARSWIPCQDSPGVRVTYDARVRVAEPYLAVMSAHMLDGVTPHTASGERELRFAMPQRVPAYLVALAAGDLRRRELGPRTAVWADPQTLESAAQEFADVEAMMTAAEQLYGPYRWGRYELLVLPPAFPFGGMENPRLTFVTPTILAGDRSLVALVAHELAHSWSGNLVTNATWADLWLNEGFTVYFERRIMEALFGKARADMEAALGRQDLERELADDLADRPLDQRLRLELTGRDPDDGFSSVPYEKGAFFLQALEEAYGREVFDAFLRGWFDTHAFASVTTDDFLGYLDAHLFTQHEPLAGHAAPKVAEWVDGPGLPAGAPNPLAPTFDTIAAQVSQWLAGQRPLSELSTASWTAHEWIHFVRALPESLSRERMAELDAAFELTRSANAEIATEWLRLAALVGYQPAYARLEQFLVDVGRRKFLVPLYKALLKTPEGATHAQEIYRRARSGYHAISVNTLDELLNWKS